MNREEAEKQGYVWRYVRQLDGSFKRERCALPGKQTTLEGEKNVR